MTSAGSNRDDKPVAMPHDRLFRRVFSEPEHARGVIEQLLPNALTQRMDWSTLSLMSSKYVPESLAHLESDLLFSVKLSERDAIVYLLVEHQSTSDRWMPLRLLGYFVEIAKSWHEKNPTQRLPAIIPLVVHHSQAGWTGPKRLSELVDLDDEDRELLTPHLPDFEFLLDDLSRTPSEELKRRTASALGRLALFMLKESRGEQSLLDSLLSWRDVVEKIAKTPNSVAALAAILSYIMRVSKATPEQVHEATKKLGEKAVEAFVSGADILIARGKAEGKAELAQRLLTLKFGALPAAAAEKLGGARHDQLDRVAELILSAESLDEVLAGLDG